MAALGALLHWRAISYLLIPLPALALVYGTTLLECPIWKNARAAGDPENQPLMEHPVPEEKITCWIRMLVCRSVTNSCLPGTTLLFEQSSIPAISVLPYQGRLATLPDLHTKPGGPACRRAQDPTGLPCHHLPGCVRNKHRPPLPSPPTPQAIAPTSSAYPSPVLQLRLLGCCWHMFCLPCGRRYICKVHQEL